MQLSLYHFQYLGEVFRIVLKIEVVDVIEFWVDRPYPCGDMGLTTPTLVYTAAFPSDTNDRSEAGPVGDAEEITIYPNPSTGNF